MRGLSLGFEPGNAPRAGAAASRARMSATIAAMRTLAPVIDSASHTARQPAPDSGQGVAQRGHERPRARHVALGLAAGPGLDDGVGHLVGGRDEPARVRAATKRLLRE